MKRLLLLGLLFSGFNGMQALFENSAQRAEKVKLEFQNAVLNPINGYFAKGSEGFNFSLKYSKRIHYGNKLAINLEYDQSNLKMNVYLYGMVKTHNGSQENIFKVIIFNEKEAQELIKTLTVEPIPTSFPWKRTIGLCGLAAASYYFYKNPNQFETAINWTCNQASTLLGLVKSKIGW